MRIDGIGPDVSFHDFLPGAVAVVDSIVASKATAKTTCGRLRLPVKHSSFYRGKTRQWYSAMRLEAASLSVRGMQDNIGVFLSFMPL